MAGFSVVPLELPDGANMYHDTFEAKYVTKYLEDYVENHVYDGRTLRDRIIFGFRVQDAKKKDGIWIVKGGDDDSKSIHTSKLVVATGHTNIPNMPTFVDQNRFQGKIVHQKDFRRVSQESLSLYTQVTALGGGKSAADMVYDSVKAGKKVSWIIRNSGEGPAAFAGVTSRGKYRNGAEISATRFFAGLSPSCFAPKSWWTCAIHESTLCQYITTKIWKGADQACVNLANFDSRPGALPGFKILKSSTEIFWATGPFGSLQQDDFWDTIARNVHVYRSDIDRLEANSIILGDGSKVSTDILFCGTGWHQNHPFLTTEQLVDFGLPHSHDDEPEIVGSRWRDLIDDADRKVLADFPKLKDPPTHIQNVQSITPSRLHNGIAPPDDRSIAFVGHVILLNSFRPAEAQAIWVTAYFDGNVRIPPKDQAMRDVAYMNAFSKRRYPSHGAAGNYFHLDLVGYTDRLMDDVGLVSHRRKGWLGNFVDPCLASDYKDMKKEYVDKYQLQN